MIDNLSTLPWSRSKKPAVPKTLDDMPTSRLRALLRDFTNLLNQQMYFWGRDVIHPHGNLLCENGFDRRESPGIKGTSCYRKPLDTGGFIELHGACAGYYDPTSETKADFLYIRNKKHCFLYTGGEPPAPGTYTADTLPNGPALDLYYTSLQFLDWWLDYEKWIVAETSASWRDQCYAAFAKLPASRLILPPKEAILWLNRYRHDPTRIVRVSEWTRSAKQNPFSVS